MSLILLLNPKQFGGTSADTSDILDRYAKRRRKIADDLLEEEVAAQILRSRQKEIELPSTVDRENLADKLKAALHAKAKPGELTGNERKKRIQMVLMLLALDDDD
jgi:hypothetical protein